VTYKMPYTPARVAITVEEAKRRKIESEVIDAWMKQTKADPRVHHETIRDWYDGKIKLIVDLTDWGIKL